MVVAAPGLRHGRGQQVEKALKKSFASAEAQARALGLPATDYGKFVREAVAEQCPNHADRVTEN